MVAAVRSWVMESQGTYQAGHPADADESATPEKVVPLRPYTKVYNDYYDALIGVVSPSAYYVLHYLIRQTCGFHRDTTRSSLSVICEATSLSRNTVIAGLRELQAMHIVTSDADILTRTQIRTYRMQPTDSWNLTASTSAKNELVGKMKQTSSKTAPVKPQTSADNALVDAPTSAKNELIKRKPERKEKREKEKQTDAHASGHGVDTPASDTPPSAPEKKSTKASKTRKERRPPTPDEEYRAALIKAVEEVRDGEKAPNHGQEWRAAGDFYRMQAPIETVIACYREEMRRPTWDTKYLSLMSLKSNYGAFVRSGPANYRAGIDRARAAVAGKYDAPRQNGRATSTSLPSTIRQLSD